GGVVSETVTVAVAFAMEPSGFLSSAVIVVVPTLTPVTTPLPVVRLEVTEATVGMLDDQVMFGELVTSSWRPLLPRVPKAINWPVWPEAETVWELGISVRAVYCSAVPAVTVNVAVPVTVLPPLPGF